MKYPSPAMAMFMASEVSWYDPCEKSVAMAEMVEPLPIWSMPPDVVMEE